MRKVRAVVKLALFLIVTFGVYSLWFLAPLLKTEKARIRLREFIFESWARAFVRIANARIRIEGRAPQPPFLLVSNHLSYFDIAALRSTIKCVFVAKADIANWFAAGTMVRNMGMIFVNRQSKRDIPRAGAEVMQALQRGEAVVVFAEGTTSNGSSVLPFKSSFLEFAATGDLPVHYASISYQSLENDLPASEAICWWREESDFVSHLLEFFKLRTFFCTITFGEKPIHSESRKILAAQLRDAVAKQFEPVN